MEIIPMVVDKNDDMGNFCGSDGAQLFINREPIARTLTCACGGGLSIHHNNMVVTKMEKTNECKMLGMMGDGGFEKVRRVYSTDALVPAISTKEDRIKICVGGLQEHQTPRKDGIAPTLNAAMGMGGGQTPVVFEKCIVAMRGRNPEHPTDRTPGVHTEQRLEKAPQGVDNTLTTVQKDNLVLEKSSIEIKQATKEGSIKCKVGGCYDASYPDSKTRRGRVQEGGDVTPTLTASNSENIHYVETQYRIRKLTPKECWRLMGYTDEDYERAAAVNSNTQLYKQAGNAIVKQVLMAIFRQMIPENARAK